VWYAAIALKFYLGVTMNVVTKFVEQKFDILVQEYKKRCLMTLPRYLRKHSEDLREIRQNRQHVTSDEARRQFDRVQKVIANQSPSGKR
jgi:hypothetical protein